MNLFELQEEKRDTEADKRYYEKEKIRLESKVMPKATNFTKEKVQTTPRRNDETLAELTQISMYLDDAIKKLENLNNLINDKYNNFKDNNNYDKQIYTEKKLLKWSNAKISARHNGIGKSTIYRIIDKIENMGKSGKV